MKGIQFWAQSYCRSTLAFYSGLASFYEVPFRICTGSRGASRKAYGWKEDEFSGYDVIHTDYDDALCKRLFEEKSDWHQVFGTYQENTPFVEILSTAGGSSPGVGICSEAPLNMFRPGPRRLAKTAYLRHLLPLRLCNRIRSSDFFVNFSGGFVDAGYNPGWPSDKVVEAGYFPPPLQGSSFRARSSTAWTNRRKTLFVSGGASWHRGSDQLPAALSKLRDLWDSFEIVYAGKIPPSVDVITRCNEIGAPVKFVGFLDYKTLVKLYEECHAFLALGREEPWGVRVNDALHCGAPLIVCDGMGAAKIIRDHQCGIAFARDSADSLAAALRTILEDEVAYDAFVSKVRIASDALLPEPAARSVGAVLHCRFPRWRKAGL